MESQPDVTHYYALDRLEEAAQSIETLAELLPVYRAKMEKFLSKNRPKAKEIYDLIVQERNRLVLILGEVRLNLLEVGDLALADATEKLCGQIAQFPIMTPNYSKLAGVLNAISTKLPKLQTANAAVIGRLMNNVKIGHYPTDPAHVELIMHGVSFPEGVVTNLFDPCCGDGSALRLLATGNNCMTYGVEIDESRAAEAQERLHRVAFGSFFHARVSNEAFHALFLNPPYLSVLNEGGGRARHEKRFLAESYEHLMVGGLLIYIIPYYRLTPDIVRILCDNFTNLSVYRFMNAEFGKFHQVAVLGTRKKREDGAALVESFLASVREHTILPELSELPKGHYALPAKPLPVPVFKGAVFNIAELASQLAASKSLSKKLSQSVLDSTSKHPILPLNVSQVGLIGGSGMINGLAMCDNPHIIKGRIVKEISVEEDVTKTDPFGNTLVTEHTEITSNKLIFNILTSNGFQSLT